MRTTFLIQYATGADQLLRLIQQNQSFLVSRARGEARRRANAQMRPQDGQIEQVGTEFTFPIVAWLFAQAANDVATLLPQSATLLGGDPRLVRRQGVRSIHRTDLLAESMQFTGGLARSV